MMNYIHTPLIALAFAGLSQATVLGPSQQVLFGVLALFVLGTHYITWFIHAYGFGFGVIKPPIMGVIKPTIMSPVKTLDEVIYEAIEKALKKTPSTESKEKKEGEECEKSQSQNGVTSSPPQNGGTSSPPQNGVTSSPPQNDYYKAILDYLNNHIKEKEEKLNQRERDFTTSWWNKRFDELKYYLQGMKKLIEDSDKKEVITTSAKNSSSNNKLLKEIIGMLKEMRDTEEQHSSKILEQLCFIRGIKELKKLVESKDEKDEKDVKSDSDSDDDDNDDVTTTQVSKTDTFNVEGWAMTTSGTFADE